MLRSDLRASGYGHAWPGDSHQHQQRFSESELTYPDVSPKLALRLEVLWTQRSDFEHLGEFGVGLRPVESRNLFFFRSS